MKIEVRDAPPRAVWALEQAGVHPLMARLYAARGVSSPASLDEALARRRDELRGVNEQLYVTLCDPSAPIRKVEEMGTGSDRLLGIMKIKWFPQLNYLERMCSDNAKRNRGESGWTFNDYIGW